MRVIAQIVDFQIQQTGVARPLDDALIQRPREHRGKQCENINLHNLSNRRPTRPRSLKPLMNTNRPNENRIHQTSLRQLSRSSSYSYYNDADLCFLGKELAATKRKRRD